MPLQIIRNDITKVACDAIVNAANPSLLGGGGVDGAIHRAAGPQLLEACKTLGGCKVGQAKITPGFHLPCKYVIHTVGPVWHGSSFGEHAALVSCYRTSLELAAANGCESVAFPLISAGAYGYPADAAFRTAVSTIADFLDAAKHEILVYLVIYDTAAVSAGSKLFAGIRQYIDDNYVDEHACRRSRTAELRPPLFEQAAYAPMAQSAPMPGVSLRDWVDGAQEETFSQLLLRKIDEKGLTDAQCYKKANVDKRLFSKIRSNADYRPSKPTVLAFCVALQLSEDETRQMLVAAGFALSHSSKFDIIVEYFIRRGSYDIFEINEALFAFGQPLLGSAG